MVGALTRYPPRVSRKPGAVHANAWRRSAKAFITWRLFATACTPFTPRMFFGAGSTAGVGTTPVSDTLPFAASRHTGIRFNRAPDATYRRISRGSAAYDRQRRLHTQADRP